MDGQKNNIQKMFRHLHKVKKNTRTSMLTKQRTKNLKKLKNIKVRLDLEKKNSLKIYKEEEGRSKSVPKG